MELRDYRRAMRRGWWLVVGALILAVGAAGVVNVTTAPQYATTTTFFVTTPHEGGVAGAYQGGMFSQHRVKSYVDLLTGDRLARAVAERENVGLDVDGIRRRIRANAVVDTVLLHVVVTDHQRDRSVAIANGVARQFKQLVEELETPPGATVSTVRVEVIAGPRLEPAPVSPRPVRNLVLGVLFGLMIGMAAAVLREMLDTSVKTVDALKQAADAPLLGTVPLDATAADAPVIREGGGRSMGRAEALRQLRTNLRVVDVDQPIKSVVVTSAVPNEGKSSTATNLAIMLAESGRRTLLIDADLRRPRIAEYLGLEGAVGLTDVLAGQARVAEVTQQWGRAGLHVLPSGFVPPNPSEMLGSQQMRDLLQSLREEFDTIVVDVPPLLPVTDAAVVASRVDGAILVTRWGKTARGQVELAANALRVVDARVLGCVLNMVPSGPGRYGYGYGYGYHSEAAAASGSASQSTSSASGPAPVPAITVEPPAGGAASVSGATSVSGAESRGEVVSSAPARR